MIRLPVSLKTRFCADHQAGGVENRNIDSNLLTTLDLTSILLQKIPVSAAVADRRQRGGRKKTAPFRFRRCATGWRRRWPD